MPNERGKRHVAKKSENISDWYHDVVIQAGLADYAETKGCIIFKPYGYALWENVQQLMDPWFKADGVQNVYFPLLIPYGLINKEKEHLKGFSPELAVVTHAGGEELAEPLVVRPTSETIMYQTFAKWIQSYRELPMKVNQWCNVVRWEKRTHPFLRTTEFLWQEGHTVHASEDDAMQTVLTALGWYRKFYEEYAAISVYAGIKSESETFAGAKRTYSIELVMPDGKALQGGTSHNLADHFAKVFAIEFLDETGERRHPFQTSWGLSTRSLGGIILAHGDDAGLVLPPRLAPVQAVVLAIGGNDDRKAADVERSARTLAEELTAAGLRVAVDTNTKQTLGYRINEWELKGVPLRLEIGGREMDEQKVAYARRDTFAKGSFARGDASVEVKKLLDAVHAELYARTEKVKQDLTQAAKTYDEFKDAIEKKRSFVRVPWCESPACEAKVKEDTKATSRVLELELMEKSPSAGACFACGGAAKHDWLFAQSY